MVIKIGNFELHPSVGSLERWDLMEVVERTEKKKGGKKYRALKTISYSTQLEYALKSIIAFNLAEKEDTVTLEEFLNAYLVEKEKIIDAIKKVTDF